MIMCINMVNMNDYYYTIEMPINDGCNENEEKNSNHVGHGIHKGVHAAFFVT